jgi:hypothetical protein
MAPSLTPGYTKPEGEVKGLNEEERGSLIHEVSNLYDAFGEIGSGEYG